MIQVVHSCVRDAKSDVRRSHVRCLFDHLEQQHDARHVLRVLQHLYCRLVIGTHFGCNIHRLRQCESVCILLDDCRLYLRAFAAQLRRHHRRCPRRRLVEMRGAAGEKSRHKCQCNGEAPHQGFSSPDWTPAASTISETSDTGDRYT